MSSSDNRRRINISRDAMFAAQNGLCHYCECALTLKNTNARNYASWDHKIAVALGGENKRDNLVLACLDCNERKSVLPYDVFVALRGWELSTVALQLLRIKHAATATGRDNLIYYSARYCPSCDIVMNLPSRPFVGSGE